jgi:protein ImuB
VTRHAGLYVENFLAAAHVRAEPRLAESPLVVLAGTPPTARVVEANVAARATGIVPGLPEAEARARCPALMSRPVSEDRTAGARAALLEACFTVSPRIEDGGPGVVFVDIVGLERLIGDDTAVGERLLRQTRAVGLPATVGITDSRSAARIIARVSPRLTVVRSGEDRSSLAAVPIGALGLEAEVARVLARWGIRTVGDLAALPRGGLAIRLGAAGLAAHDQALGIDREPFRAWTPPPFWEEAQGIEWEIETWAGLAPVLEAVLSRLVGRLSAAHRAADGLAIDLALATGGRDERVDASGRSSGVRLARRRHEWLERDGIGPMRIERDR